MSTVIDIPPPELVRIKFFDFLHPSLPDQCNLRSKMHGVIHWADGSMDSRIKYGYDEGVKFFVHPHPSLQDLVLVIYHDDSPALPMVT